MQVTECAYYNINTLLALPHAFFPLRQLTRELNAFKLWKQTQCYTPTEKITRASKIYKGLRADAQMLLTARIVRSPKFLFTAHGSPTNLTAPCGSDANAASVTPLAPVESTISCGCRCTCQGSRPAHWPKPATVRFSSAQSGLPRALTSEQQPKTKFMLLFATLGPLPNSRHLPVHQIEQMHPFSSSLKPIYLFLIIPVW